MSAAPQPCSPLASAWMAGFEGADHVNMHGQPLDMVGITGHDADVDHDYRRLAQWGFRSVRESIGWRLAEPQGRGRFDFSRTLRFAAAAQRHGLQLLWSLMHYGVPPDVSLMDESFCARFVDFAAAAARALRPYSDHPPVYTPINEISFLSWAACESNLIHPHIGDRADPRRGPLPDGFELKVRLVRATLAAMRAIRAEDPRARFLHIDPLVHVVPPRGATPELAAEALRFREFQWQAWDMLAGKLLPELGGSGEELDLVGVNHYHNAQWEFGSGAALDWEGPDARRMPFGALLEEAWRRYRRPLVVAETGHVGALRGRWLEEMDAGVRRARSHGVPVLGLCLYPAIDRPDWNDTADWHRSGLWDAAPSGTTLNSRDDTAEASAHPGRHLDLVYAAALRRCRSGDSRPASAIRLLPTPATVFSAPTARG